MISPMSKERFARWFLHYRTVWLILFDGCAASVAWLSMAWLRTSLLTDLGPLNPFHVYLQAWPWLVLAWLAVCWITGLYGRGIELFGLRQVRAIMVAVLLFAGCAMSLGFITKQAWDLGRSVVLMTVAANAVVLPVSRVCFELACAVVWRQGHGRMRTVIVGCGPLAQTVWDRLVSRPLSLHQVLGYLAPAQTQENVWAERQWLGPPKDLAQLAALHHLDEVCFADPDLQEEVILDIIAQCQARKLRFRVASADLFQVYTNQSVDLEEVDGVPVVTLANGAPGLVYFSVKRLTDLACGALLLVCMLLLWPLISYALHRRLKGSILFKQSRAGLYGRPFTMYKFRTMFEDVEEYDHAPIGPGDPRVVPGVGAWLRRTSLDELPQCLNVLKGEMSLVGPRPELPFLAVRYQPWQRRRLSVKPGITGLWQILGRKDLPLHSNLEYDFYYIHNQALMLDLTILLKTIPVVLFGKGAY